MLSTLLGLLMTLVGLLEKQQTIVYAQEIEPKVVLIGTTTKEKSIEEKIRQTFYEEPDRAVAIAKAESGLNPNAFNPEKHKGCVGSIGIMQIACVHHKEAPNELTDVALNLMIARRIYEESGWNPWGVCTDGKVDCGLK